MSHYIWNRAERVDPKLMPNILRTSFACWQKGKLNEINDFTSKKRIDRILYTIKVQKINMQDAIKKFNNKVKEI